METGIVFNIQKFSVHDGPGIRTTVFLKGCPLRCPWCHNPEGLSREPEVAYDPRKCIGCGGCLVCEHGCHSVTETEGHQYARHDCTVCTKCLEHCCTGALELTGKSYTTDEVIQKVMADKAFYDKSGGGMTVSGGEPLYQPAFTKALLEAAKEKGLHTAMETSGFASSAVFTSMLPYLDMLLFDYKVTGENAYEEITGVPFAPILSNLHTANESGIPIILRCPIIPGINDNETHFDAIAALADEFSGIIRVDLEPYHALGTGKAERFGKECGFSTEAPSKERMQEIRGYIGERCSKEVIVS